MNAELQNYFNTLCCGGGCTCPEGYTKDVKTGLCVRNETMPPTISNSGFCFAPSRFQYYSKWGSRIYNYPFNNNAIEEDIFAPASSSVLAVMNSVPQWQSDTNANGPMNRAGIWIDNNCDGNKDALAEGTQATIVYKHENTGVAKMIYVGVAADNQFVLKINGAIVADSLAAGAAAGIPPGQENNHFWIWHIIPVMLPVGTTYFNVVATGDGSTSDSVAMVIYDNTAPQIQAATADSQLNILFTTASLIGTSNDIATCLDGWSLDTSGGPGNYVCRRTLTTTCG